MSAPRPPARTVPAVIRDANEKLRAFDEMRSQLVTSTMTTVPEDVEARIRSLRRTTEGLHSYAASIPRVRLAIAVAEALKDPPKDPRRCPVPPDEFNEPLDGIMAYLADKAARLPDEKKTDVTPPPLFTVEASSIRFGSPSVVAEVFNGATFTSMDAPGQYIQYTFHGNLSVGIEAYRIARGHMGIYPTEWELHISDGTNGWTSISIVTMPQWNGSFVHCDLQRPVEWVKSVRLVQKTSSVGNNTLSLAAFELFGDVRGADG